MSKNPPAQAPDFSVAYKRFALVMLTVVYAFNFIDRQILVILQEPVKADMGLSDSQLGLLSGFTFALVYVIAGIPIAYWADRGNRRNIVALALAVWSGMTTLSGFVQNYTQLLLARVGVGLGEAGGSPPSHSMISDYYPPEKRGTALSFYSMGAYIGILLGFMLGGIVADTFGWRMAFVVVGLPGVVFAIALRLSVKEPLRGRWETGSTDKVPTLRATLAVLRRTPSFWYIAIGAGLISYTGYGNGNFFPSYLVRSHHMSLAQVGVTLALVTGVFGMLGTFLGGFLGDRYARKDVRWYLWIPALGGLVAFPASLYVLLSDNTVLALVIQAGVTLLATLYLGPCIAMSHLLVPATMRAFTSAILFFILNIIGLGLGPLVTGLLSDVLQAEHGNNGLRYAMVTTACVGLLGIVSLYLGGRRLAQDLKNNTA